MLPIFGFDISPWLVFDYDIVPVVSESLHDVRSTAFALYLLTTVTSATMLNYIRPLESAKTQAPVIHNDQKLSSISAFATTTSIDGRQWP